MNKIIHLIIFSVIWVVILLMQLFMPDTKSYSLSDNTHIYDQRSGGSAKYSNILTAKDPYFTKIYDIEPFSTKWADGTLTPQYPRHPYVNGNGEVFPQQWKNADIVVEKRPLHWGQRKLLLSEIDFITDVLDSDKKDKNIYTLIYAGSADGKHIPLLCELFPSVNFHLYDPRKFHDILIKYAKEHPERVKFNPYSKDGMFNDEVAKKYVGRNDHKTKLLFVSDIRISPSEDDIERDQRYQENWVNIIKPYMYMLKFKLPYTSVGKSKTYKYLDGKIRLQCWANNKSIETRLIGPLIPGKFKSAKYDIILYEQQCAWFNNIMRLHDVGNMSLSSFGINIDKDKTINDFWKDIVPVNYKKGYDFVYELQILSKIKHDKNLDESNKNLDESRFLLDIVEKINDLLLQENTHKLDFIDRLRFRKY